MKVTATIQSTATNELNIRVNDPVDMVWCKDTDALGAVMAVSQLLSQDDAWVETLAIRIEL